MREREHPGRCIVTIRVERADHEWAGTRKEVQTLFERSAGSIARSHETSTWCVDERNVWLTLSSAAITRRMYCSVPTGHKRDRGQTPTSD
jgi:hypothetical protein